jgi:phage-related tail fiber protein
MAKITRNNQKVFGDNSAVNNFYQFGNSNVTTKDVATMQAGNWLNGWSDGGVNINGVITPEFQEFNTLSYVTTSQIAYLQQEGIAEWHTETEYHQNSIIKESGTTKLYVSLTNNNTGNAVNSGGDNAFWKFAGDLVSLVSSQVLAGSIMAYSAQTVPAGYLECDGSTLDTTQYADLFNTIAYTYGGSGASFNIPDLRGEFIRGWDNSRGIDSGRTFGSSQQANVVVPRDDWGAAGPAFDPNSSGQLGRLMVASGQPEISESLESIRVAATDKTITTNDTRPRNIALKYIIRF